ncbi:MAG: glycerol-3-phosphate 1-O-acyltransferase PlsY [Candidatus Eisenbacteria bacterium]
MGNWALVILASFVLGSIPTALWCGRALRGIDLREHGSGNLGATNVYRVLGRGWGITVLLLDAAKGSVAVALARHLAGETSGGAWLPIAALFASVAGHMFTPFARWRGGKGVATTAGGWLALAPQVLAIVLGFWILVFACTRIVSIASILAGLALPIVLAWKSDAPISDPMVWAGAAVGLLILIRHRANIQRLRRGEESRLVLRGAGTARTGSRPAGSR